MRRLLPLLFLLVCWPLRDAILGGKVAGAGPDVASTLWAMWWFSKEWASGAWGAHTTLVNFPEGAWGTVLSPITAATWTVLSAAIGEAAASTWTDVLYLGAFVSSVAWLAREAGASPYAAAVAGVGALAQRYLVFAVGETSLVGVTGITVPVGLVALLRIARGERRWALVLGACVALTGVEIPYLVPVLPVAALMAMVRGPRAPVIAGLLGGVVGLAGFAVLQGHSQSGDFGFPTSPAHTQLGPWRFLVVEAPWARSAWRDLVLPGPVKWSLDARASEAATGRDYLGLSVVIGSMLTLRRREAWPFVALGWAGVLLATGSDWWGMPSPFGLMNSACMRLVRGLTQPTRYLLLPAIGFPVATALALDGTRWRSVGAAIVTADAFAFGGLSLRLPTMELPLADCVVALRDEPADVGMLTWPWDGSRAPDGTVRRRLYQIAHGHPAALFGVGSWRMAGDTPMSKRLEDLGWRDATDGTRRMDPSALYTLGYRFVVADAWAGPALMERAIHNFGPPVATCEGAAVHAIRP